jgi:hypothetical protein
VVQPPATYSLPPTAAAQQSPRGWLRRAAGHAKDSTAQRSTADYVRTKQTAHTAASALSLHECAPTTTVTIPCSTQQPPHRRKYTSNLEVAVHSPSVKLTWQNLPLVSAWGVAHDLVGHSMLCCLSCFPSSHATNNIQLPVEDCTTEAEPASKQMVSSAAAN